MCNCRAGPTKARGVAMAEGVMTTTTTATKNNKRSSTAGGVHQESFASSSALVRSPSPSSCCSLPSLRHHLLLPRTTPSSSHPRLRCVPTSRCCFANGCSCSGASGVGLFASSLSSSFSASAPPATAFLMAFARGPIAPGVCRALLGIQTSGLGLGLALGVGLGCERAAVAWLLDSGKGTATGIW